MRGRFLKAVLVVASVLSVAVVCDAQAAGAPDAIARNEAPDTTTEPDAAETPTAPERSSRT